MLTSCTWYQMVSKPAINYVTDKGNHSWISSQPFPWVPHHRHIRWPSPPCIETCKKKKLFCVESRYPELFCLDDLILFKDVMSAMYVLYVMSTLFRRTQALQSRPQTYHRRTTGRPRAGRSSPGSKSLLCQGITDCNNATSLQG